ncbi:MULTISPECIES: GT-D fold domain-containing glycosyltransferase [unclassified Microbacterium]|uniref:GT-D fold domain-containing glycosyltransferase n=1 Tax=unclassified Microbacterium TaxID=2609290 RepID=UPI0012FD8329|nr:MULTISPECIES: GT-D fold domain-containing glycosyltransferase [unclassified Microbacterium]
MTYYILLLLAKLIPGSTRRQRFVAAVRQRFSVRAIIDAAIAEQRASLETLIYRTQMAEAPVTMTVDQTLDALIEGKSIARFGAGDLSTMDGWFEMFQTPGVELTRRLREVLVSDESDLLVAIPSFAYELSPELLEGMRDYFLRWAPHLRRILNPYLRTSKRYAATEVSLGHSTFGPGFDRRAYFERCRQIWDGAPVVLIHGEGIFDGFTHDIFDNAASVDHILAPRQNAFDEYDDILRRASLAPKECLMIAILGPTATVLAYDLHRAGYRALDLGHIAKSYEWWRNERTAATEEFFAAD